VYRLLIADDEKLERDALRFIVQRGSLAVSEIAYAANGREAIAKVADFVPDIAFLDIKMPGVNGIEAARKIKQLVPDVHIVFLTAFDYFDYAHEAIRIGVDDFLVKPASDTRVIEVISRITSELDREREQRLHSEKNEQKIGQVTGVMEGRIEESLARGFVDLSTLMELFGFLELEFEAAAAFRAGLSFELYPMRIESDAQRLILRKRCLNAVRSALAGPRTLVFGAVVPEGISGFVGFAAGREGDSNPDIGLIERKLPEISARIMSEFSVAVTFGLSSVRTDLERLDELLSEAAEAMRWGEADASGRIRKGSRVAPARSAEGEWDFPPEELEQRLVRSVISSDVAAADRAVDDLFKWLAGRKKGIAAVRAAVAESVIVLRHAVSRQLRGWEYSDAAFTMELAESGSESAVESLVRAQMRKMIRVSRAIPERSVPAAVEQTSSYIEAHYAEEITLERLAAMTGHSVYHLSRLFRQHTGVTLVEFLTAVRLRRARELLLQENLAIKEVSARIGYSDPTYFARVFRKSEGVAPSEYREHAARARLPDPSRRT